MHEGWKPYFEKWVVKAEEKDKQESEIESKRIDSEIQETEVKLNRLLDGYLDRVIDPEIYNQKKNDLSIMAKKVGSNYSLLNRRLSYRATALRAPHPMISQFLKWRARRDSNPQPPGPKPGALAVTPRAPLNTIIILIIVVLYKFLFCLYAGAFMNTH